MSQIPYRKPLTRAGYQRLAEEHRQLLEEERPKVVDGVATAAAEGDRSENAEYIYGKKRLREIDKRLRYLTSLIDEAQVVDPENIRSDRIEFGATVTIVDEEGLEKTWSIVGMGEADASRGTISWQSPLAKALHQKKVGDFIILKRPAGEMEYEVLAIEYRRIT
ncbi:transcription elongation factor GreB [Pseudobacteriovorax antillogorgiicola]|uniref:Transcription elongation factor GreB n=1 Tax=Pseudobacteriovorax antillogorgiicola TaxID=1513793 RepID=A0A1Y6BIS4_9BACT|nr:transcription elongation factor GreB [Pseudobacteriovorax antillogorgiicola]TCS55370.1 transcription elongation factor GreB [Pseudobacteriovorax antillogorgiicola]SMF13455.1 transcription elongation factor GreB [Pseudobacteriovorax antillogorgiicola]